MAFRRVFDCGLICLRGIKGFDIGRGEVKHHGREMIVASLEGRGGLFVR